jgi:hypothetical protein
MFRTDASIAGPAACTRGNSRRVRSQNFTSREINDYCASVSVRMNFFTNRVAGWWNVLPNNIIEAKNLNAFKARLDEWLVLNNRKLFQWSRSNSNSNFIIFFLLFFFFLVSYVHILPSIFHICFCFLS